MVVSGVPTPNGDQHGKEIANMALELVHASETFIIPHLPSEPLKIRVGLHSGKFLGFPAPSKHMNIYTHVYARV